MRAFQPTLVQTPLLRADVTPNSRCTQDWSHPLLRPKSLSPCTPSSAESVRILSEQAEKTPLELATLERLGQQIRELVLRRYLVQTHLTILHGLVSEVLADIDVLRSLTSPHDVV
jgi:hypothetical protein